MEWLNMNFNLFDVVIVNENIVDKNLKQGNIGTIVEVLAPDAFIVEFVDRKGEVYAESTLRASQLVKVLYESAVLSA